MAETIYGFIGLGDRGGLMAARLAEGGMPLVVFDVNDKATQPFDGLTSQVATSVEDLATCCDVVFSVLTGRNRASEELFLTQVLTGAFSQGAQLDILAKDTQLAVAAA